MRCQALTKEYYGKDHPLYLNSISSTSLLDDHEIKAKAFGIHTECARVRKIVLGEKHPSYLHSLQNIGIALFRLHRY